MHTLPELPYYPPFVGKYSSGIGALEHARHWRAHYRQYHACGEQVFFVAGEWYNR